MTLAELERAIDSKKRQQKTQEQRQANYDYILADLIGRSVARVHNSANKMPPIEETYPSLFDNEEIKAQRQAKEDELSALRFRQFADSFNKRFKEAKTNE